ncbi:MAG: hypothetical protein JKX84_09555 [Flavobacteriales bacterium]|nr:hypothetical protein [Flavobacteriales bacterium]
MIRIILMTLCLLFGYSAILAQEETSEKPVKDFNDKLSSVHEIGINATFFFNTFLSFNTVNPVVVSPYAFTYKYRKGMGAFRLGIGGAYRNGNNIDSDFETTNAAIDVRLGGEFSTPLGRKWRTSVGADAVFSYANSSSNNGSQGQNIITQLNDVGYGAGPVLGIELLISKRIKIGTEASIIFKNTNQSQKVFFGSPFQEDIEQKARTLEVVFNLPTSLHLIIML